MLSQTSSDCRSAAVQPLMQKRPLPVPPLQDVAQRPPSPQPPSGGTGRNRGCQYNFCSVTHSDGLLFGAERPGQPRPDPTQAITPRGPLVATEVVDSWCQFMLSKSIKRVLAFVHAAELSFYETPLLETYRQVFDAALVVDPTDPGALSAVCGALDSARLAGEAMVVHCSTGQVRTGNVLALALHRAHGITISTAVEQVTAHAVNEGAVRRPTMQGVIGLLVGEPAVTPRPAPPPLPPLPAACAQAGLHITFIQTGGTIDKDYPKAVGGYAFEIGPAATTGILSNVALGFTYDTKSVCQKDSSELTEEDRRALAGAIGALPTTRCVVTHGTDTLLDTGKYLGGQPNLKDKVVVLTGAQRPHALTNSDAAFNVGAAVAAVGLLQPGVYIAMNACVYPVDRTVRDHKSGVFSSVQPD